MGKLKFFSHNQKFLKDFKKEKDRISKFIKNVEIHHIGSTAVPGLGGKGIIDIMIGINDWKELDGIIEKLKSMGFSHIHPKENERVFLSKEGFTGLGDTHIHIIKKRGKTYRDLLSFRDCLISDRKESERYFNLKLKWLKEFKGDRAKYTKEKESYVKDILKRVKKTKRFIWHKTTDYFSLKPITQVYGVCFDRGGNILIIRHSNENWNIPGGKPEDSETPEQTLKRELDEEADVTIGKNIMIGYYEVISDKSTIYQLRFAALLEKKNPRTIDPDSGSVKERKFVSPDEFFNYVKIKDYHPMIDEAISWFKKNREL